MLENLQPYFQDANAWQKLRKKMLDVHGQAAENWLEQLPDLLQKYQNLWGLKIIAPVKNLSYNLVLHAEMPSTQTIVIVKLAPPNQDFNNEITALEYFAGHGMVKLLKANPSDGIMLLEQAIPGTMLSSLTMHGRDAEATTIYAAIIKMLHLHPVVITSELRNLPKVSDRLFEFAEAYDQIAADPKKSQAFDLKLLKTAAAKFEDLCKTTRETVVLHGDLHHYNILTAKRQPWLAIDPKGIIGDPMFEVAAYMCNPAPQLASLPHLKDILSTRLELLHGLLDFDFARMLAWSFAHAVLVAAQNLISHGEGWREWLLVAKTLDEIR